MKINNVIIESIINNFIISSGLLPGIGDYYKEKATGKICFVGARDLYHNLANEGLYIITLYNYGGTENAIKLNIQQLQRQYEAFSFSIPDVMTKWKNVLTGDVYLFNGVNYDTGQVSIFLSNGESNIHVDILNFYELYHPFKPSKPSPEIV